MQRILVALLALLFLLPVELQASWDKTQPLTGTCGTENTAIYKCVWDESSHTWVETYVGWDNWEWQVTDPAGRKVVQDMHKSHHNPVKKTYKIVFFGKFYRHPEHWAAMGGVILPVSTRGLRFLGINVDEGYNGGPWPLESRVWPHLGLNVVGTIAERLHYEVALWDEFHQGPVSLDLIKEGDIVGLSLVTTGIERGVQLAQEAKLRGARYVIVGNDSAIFRAPQLLRYSAIDAVATSDNLMAIHTLLAKVDQIPLERLRIPGIATRTTGASLISNEFATPASQIMQEELFTIPNLGLYGPEYWEGVWSNYRKIYKKRHSKPESVKNALALLSHGCGRAVLEKCKYCTIGDVGIVRIPDQAYLERTIAAYRDFGVDTFFNVADSSIEMAALLDNLEDIGASFDTLVMYGRAQVMAKQPELIERWVARVGERVLFNCGMDSASETMLKEINKSSRPGSRLAENEQALINLKRAGEKAHLHFSLIFGSPGETKESCKASLEFVDKAIAMLGRQLDVCEADIWWLNHGQPASRIFRDYDEAKKLAERNGKEISREAWYREFGQHVDTLAVPWQCEEAWYYYFTRITVAEAQAYRAQVDKKMESVEGSIRGREYAHKPPPSV